MKATLNNWRDKEPTPVFPRLYLGTYDSGGKDCGFVHIRVRGHSCCC